MITKVTFKDLTEASEKERHTIKAHKPHTINPHFRHDTEVFMYCFERRKRIEETPERAKPVRSLSHTKQIR